MTDLTSTSTSYQVRLPLPSLRNALLWALCGIPLVHALLLLTTANPLSPQTIVIHFLRPVGILGAFFVLALSASLARGHQRWAWIFVALSMLPSFIFSILRITLALSPSAPVMKLLEVLIYLCALMGSAFYLQRYSWWVGNTLRVVMGGITVGYAAYVFIRSIAAIVPIWRAQANVFLPFIAFDTGILFAMSVTGLRYGIAERPIIPLILESVLCLLIADTAYLMLNLTPGNDHLLLNTMPLYTLHNILVALAAYRDVTYSKQISPIHIRAMPLLEWTLWTFVPLISVLAALVATSVFGRLPFSLLLGLLVVAVIHEILAALDYRSVLNNLYAAHDQVRATAATMEAFVARIIHDLAPPVQGLLSVVRDASWREDQHFLQHILAGQVALLEAFVHQARAYITARTVPLKQSRLDLLPICLSAVAAARPRAEQRNVRIVQNILVESPTMVGDETAVRRILDNLLTNAVGISPPGGEVVLSMTAPTPKQIEISVSDQGPGISSEQQAQLFKPYTSLQFPSLKDHGRSPSPTGTGMGLGLAIVKELCLALGGDCGVTSAPNAGSTFYVRLPIEPSALPQVHEGEPA